MRIIKQLLLVINYVRNKFSTLSGIYCKGIIVTGGRIYFDPRSKIVVRGKSTLRVNGTLKLSNTILILNDSSMECGYLSISESYLNFKDSQILMGNNGIIGVVNLKSASTEITIANDYSIINQRIKIKNSKIIGGDFINIDGGTDSSPVFSLMNSILEMGNNVNLKCRLSCDGSKMVLDNNIFINPGTEIRCEKSIHIQSNVFISYQCLILDTNTHSIDPMARLDEILQGYPNSTLQTEKSRPITSPVDIGNNVWIGMRSAILKGTKIRDNSVVGLMSVVSGKFPQNSIIVGNPGKVVKRISKCELPNQNPNPIP